ncbi:hypothetical protein B0H16DRAFT_1414207 [Mycena metata]|uniref:Uncharacterized protein n=1 Tax=Mycena metata TaxID=1033252 RepID=A0AAD7JEY0_9AGAR|nr:hypothetical protein B0H16DRAFT_1414207 [Mycena metata]
MSNFLQSTTDFVGNTARQGAQGVQSVGDTAKQGAEGLGKGVNSGVNTLTGAFTPGGNNQTDSNEQSNPSKPPADASDSTTKPTDTGADKAPGSQSSGPLSGIAGGVSSGLQTGANFVGDVTKTGLSIGENVAKTGADMTGNVVFSAVGLAGTAIGGVVNAAAETSGKVFEPVAAGLRSIEGLEGLADNLEKINGLPVAAVKQVGSWTLKAINMSGKTPTFFDRDGDGIVQVQDTIDGLIVLGLSEKSATYGAYVLHGVFSYSTSDSWIPSKDTALPIHTDKLNETRWGKNWGSFDRIEWCSDMDIETFFDTADENTPTLEKWKQTLTKGRQGFGVLLLIFEWGTTWPWLMPDLPLADLPFKDDIGKVVRTVILPTIFKNWQIAHGIKPNQDSEPISKKENDLERESKDPADK